MDLFGALTDKVEQYLPGAKMQASRERTAMDVRCCRRARTRCCGAAWAERALLSQPLARPSGPRDQVAKLADKAKTYINNMSELEIKVGAPCRCSLQLGCRT